MADVEELSEDAARFQTLQKEYAASAGMFLMKFNRIEDYLFKLCRAALQTDARRAAVVYYQSLLESRVKVVDGLLREHLTRPEDMVLWDDIHKLIGKLRPVRNMIAHGVFTRHSVMRIGPNGHTSVEEYGSNWAIWEQAVNPKRKTPAVTNAQVVSETLRLDALLLKLDSFSPLVSRPQPARRIAAPKATQRKAVRKRPARKLSDQK